VALKNPSKIGVWQIKKLARGPKKTRKLLLIKHLVAVAGVAATSPLWSFTVENPA